MTRTADLSTAAPWRVPAKLVGGNAPAPAASLLEDTTRPPRAMRWALIALVVCLLTTQRMGVQVGSGYFGLSLPLTYALLAVLMLSGRLVLDTLALVLYGLIATAAAASFWFNTGVQSGNPASIASLLLLLTLYLPMVFVLSSRQDNRAHWLWTMRLVGNVLLVAAVAGIVQFYVQFFFRPTWLFDISELIPLPIRGQGVYNSSIPVGSVFKANGFFFREPSGFSFMMAFGLLLELALFKRAKRMLCLGLALVLSYSGTGLLALAVGLVLPFRASMLFKLGVGAAVVVVGNAMAGDPLNLAYTVARLGEFGKQGSSAYMRYVAPMNLVDGGIDVTPWAALLGHGSGTIDRAAALFDSHDPTWAKLLVEYGIAGFVLFVGLMLYKLAGCLAPLQLRAVAFASWLVMGGHLLSPENVCFFFVVFALWPAPGPERLDSPMNARSASTP